MLITQLPGQSLELQYVSTETSTLHKQTPLQVFTYKKVLT